jgi:hypothetical protein
VQRFRSILSPICEASRGTRVLVLKFRKEQKYHLLDSQILELNEMIYNYYKYLI